MTNRYAVLGAGTQGVAIAYDLARFGNAELVVLADIDESAAHKGALAVNMLLRKEIVLPIGIDVDNDFHLAHLFENVDAVVSAISFKKNVYITEAAIIAGVHMCDLGGNTPVVRAQHEYNDRAQTAGVSIVPDCGMGPGFNLALAHSALSAMHTPESLMIYCGGLPQHPEGELQYSLCFSMGGLVNEYSGYADVLEHGKVTQKPCLGSVETLELQIGEFEAAYTSGGLSTAPWSYQKEFPSLQNLSYKTLRYPGHWKLLRKFRKAGRLAEELEARLGVTPQVFPDLGLIIVKGTGRDASGRTINVFRSVFDAHDRVTGFTAMQRLTGFHASIVAILSVQGKVPRGVIPVELINGDSVIMEMDKRGIVTDVI